jgi:hypothetical protein
VVRFRLKGCGKCGGDLALDEGDWLCLQCGTYYYVNLYTYTNARHGEVRRRPPGLPGGGLPWPPATKGGIFPPYPASGEQFVADQATIAASAAVVLWGYPAVAP